MTYKEICEERLRVNKERLKMLKRWEDAGWEVDYNHDKVSLPNKPPPYDELDKP